MQLHTRSPLALLVLLRLLPCAGVSAARGHPSQHGGGGWEQQRFTIGFLTNVFDGQGHLGPPGIMRRYYEAIASLNFTLSHIAGGSGNETVLAAHLAEAEALGLDLIAMGTPPHLSNSSSPALLGYFLGDEPSAVDFPADANMTAEVAARHPGKLRFINLLPLYCECSNGRHSVCLVLSVFRRSSALV